MLSLGPVRALWVFCGIDHSGAMRGNTTNSSSITGTACASSLPASMSGCGKPGAGSPWWRATMAAVTPAVATTAYSA